MGTSQKKKKNTVFKKQNKKPTLNTTPRKSVHDLLKRSGLSKVNCQRNYNSHYFLQTFYPTK